MPLPQSLALIHRHMQIHTFRDRQTHTYRDTQTYIHIQTQAHRAIQTQKGRKNTDEYSCNQINMLMTTHVTKEIHTCSHMHTGKKQMHLYVDAHMDIYVDTETHASAHIHTHTSVHTHVNS